MRLIGPNRSYKHIRMIYNALDYQYHLKSIRDKITDQSKGILDNIGREGRRIIQDNLEPLNRTGSLNDSWNISIGKDYVKIYSEDWAASSIQSGFSQPAPKNEFLSWMNSKSEFSGKTRKEKERISFAIRRSMINKSKPGNQSTLVSLDPIGKRQYKYLQPSRESLRKYIEQLLKGFKI